MKPLHVERPTFVASSNEKRYISDSPGNRWYWPTRVEILNAGTIKLTGENVKALRTKAEQVIFTSWLEGVCACKTGVRMKDNPKKHDTVEWRAWGRGYRAWERDAKHRK